MNVHSSHSCKKNATSHTDGGASNVISDSTSSSSTSSSVPCIHSVQFDTGYSPIAPK